LKKLKKQSELFKTPEEYLVNLIKHIDKNDNGIIEFEELSIGMKE